MPPKPPSSAYFLYCKDRRNILKEQNPKATFGEISKMLGREWRDLDKSVKQNYVNQAKANFEKHEIALKKFNDMHRHNTKKKSKGKCKKKAKILQRNESKTNKSESKNSELTFKYLDKLYVIGKSNNDVDIPWTCLKSICTESQIKYFSENEIFNDLTIGEGLLEAVETSDDISLFAIGHIHDRYSVEQVSYCYVILCFYIFFFFTT